MKRIGFFTLLISFYTTLSVRAQQDYAADALLYSYHNLSGTARFQGIGGAQTALGADMGSISGNPAGLGQFKKSEVSITPALSYVFTSSDYINQTTSDSKFGLNVPNFGVVFASPKSDITPGKWRGGAFGMSFSRQASFQNRYSFDGVNQRSSILDRFVLDANIRGATVNTLRNEYSQDGTSSAYDGGATSMYYNAYLINPYFNGPDTTGSNGGLNNNTYFQFEAENEPFGTPRSLARQQKTFDTKGASNQWNFGYGGNFDDRLYFGVTLAIASLHYKYTNKYDETYFSESEDHGKAFYGMTLNEDYSIRGTGVNLNFGLIFRVNDVFRLGGSIVTPTWYNMNETYNSSVDVNPYDIPFLDYNGYDAGPNSGLTPPPGRGESFTVSTAPRTFNYKLTTPWRMTGGAAFFIGKSGFVSADIEYIAYDQMKVRSNDDASFESDYVNGNPSLGITGIKNQYQSAINVKLGGEFRMNTHRFRLGGYYQADPYQQNENNNLDRTRLNFSAGWGIRLPNFYFDVTAVYSQYKSANTPYVLPDNTTYASALIQNRMVSGVFTFGTFF